MEPCHFRPQLGPFLEQTLAPAEWAELEQHLSDCADCQTTLEYLSGDDVHARWRDLQGTGPPAAAPAFVSRLQRLGPDGAESGGRKAASDLPPPTVPGFVVERELGRGGMGVVYLARQTSLNRFVALKMILTGALAGPRELVRLRVEAEIVARLEHPHIVRIYETGEYAGLPYLCLEYLPGGTLSRKLGGVPQPADDAARTVETLARAVAHAHAQGVVHRDLKPANVLLAADGTPKVSDFGLAQFTAAGPAASASRIAGTPSYMAPEQAAGGRDVGPAADVYSLGTILYKMLVGRPPFRAESPLETLLLVAHADPIPPRRLRPRLAVDLETVCLKCLEKAPAARYPDALALADELRRFRAGEPIVARPLRLPGRVAKWARRRPVIAGLLAAVVSITLVSFGLVTWLLDRATTAAGEERKARVDLERTAAGVWLDRGAAQCDKGDVAEGLMTLAHALRLAVKAHAPDLERVARVNLAAWPSRLVRLRAKFPHNSWAYAVAYSPDGKTIATAGDDRLVKVWGAATGEPALPPLEHAHPVWCLAFAPDGKTLVSGGGPFDDTKPGEARVWDATTGTELARLPQASAVLRVEYAPGGGAFLTSGEREVRVWDARTFAPRGKPLPHPGEGKAATFSPDARLVATGGADNAGRLWDAATGEPVGPPLTHAGPGGVNAVAFHPGGKQLATGGQDGQVRVWEVAGARAVHTLGHSGPVNAVAFSPDGAYLAAACGGQRDRRAPDPADDLNAEARVWDAAAGTLHARLPHTHKVWAVAFSPDGRYLLTGSRDGRARLFDLVTGAVCPPLHHEGTVVQVAFDPSGGPAFLTASAGGDQFANARLWAIPPVRPAVAAATRPDTTAVRVAFAADGRLMLGYHNDPRVVAYDSATGRPTGLVFHHGPKAAVTSHALTADGTRLLTACEDGSVHVWAADGKLLRSCGTPGAGVSSVVQARTPDGRAFWAASRDRSLRRWALDGGADGPPVPVPGRVLGTWAGADGSLVWVETDTTSHRLVRWTEAGGPVVRWQQPGRAFNAAFTPDGGRVLLSDGGTAARVEDAETGRQVGPTLLHPQQLDAGVALSPDGRTFATGDRENNVRLWDAATLKPLGPPLAHCSAVRALAFRPDGTALATAGQRTLVWQLPDPHPGTPDEIGRWAAEITGISLDQGGFVDPTAGARAGSGR